MIIIQNLNAFPEFLFKNFIKIKDYHKQN